MLWSLLATALASPCEEAISAAALAERSEAVLDAFVARDPDGLVAAADAARTALPCVNEPLPRETVATWFRYQGMARFFDDDRNGAVQMFVPARLLDPDFVFPDDVMGPSHPMRKTYDNIPVEQGPTRKLPPPVVGALNIDGRTGLVVPEDRAYMFQHVQVDGSVTATTVVFGGATPPYKAVEVVAPPDPPDAPEVRDDPPGDKRVDIAVMFGIERTRTKNLRYSTAQGLFGVHVRVTPLFGVEVAVPLGIVLDEGNLAWSARIGPRLTVGDRVHGTLAAGVRASFNNNPGTRLVAPTGYLAGGIGLRITDTFGLRAEVGPSYGLAFARGEGAALTIAGHAGLTLAL